MLTVSHTHILSMNHRRGYNVKKKVYFLPQAMQGGGGEEGLTLEAGNVVKLHSTSHQ